MITSLNSITAIIPAPLLSFGLTTIATFVAYWLRPRVKLIWGLKTSFVHVVRPKKDGDQPIAVHTAHFVIQNSGRAPAKDVEAVLNYAPDEVSVWPQRACHFETNHENRLIVKFEFLSPREFVDLIILNINRDLPIMLNVKCPESVGKQVELNYHRVLPKIVYMAMIASMFFGVVFLVEKLIRYLVG